MIGYRREQTEERSQQVNQQITEDALDSIVYRPNYPATVLSPYGTAAFGVGNGTAFLTLPNAVGGGGNVSLPIPTAYWIKGVLSVRIIWSGTVASAVTNVQWLLSMSLTKYNAAPATVSLATVDLAGPAVISALQDYTFSAGDTFPVDSSHILLGISLQRNGAAAGDTYAGDAKLQGFQVIYTPAAGH